MVKSKKEKSNSKTCVAACMEDILKSLRDLKTGDIISLIGLGNMVLMEREIDGSL